MTQDAYALGHAEHELERLMQQGEYFGMLTEQVFRHAGITPGMTVLDAGCGAGDVSLLAARLVGPTGRVIGVDRSAEAVAVANKRAEALANVHFVVGDLASIDLRALGLEAPIDAVVGRLVLMYFPDPARALAHLASLVKPGGVVAFHEVHIPGAMSVPRTLLFDAAIGWVTEALRRVGANPSMGLALSPAFRGAALGHPRMLLGARIESGPGAQGYVQLAGIVRTLLPAIVGTGVASAEDVGIDDLADRLRDVFVREDATLVAPMLVGGWARVPE